MSHPQSPDQDDEADDPYRPPTALNVSAGNDDSSRFWVRHSSYWWKWAVFVALLPFIVSSVLNEFIATSDLEIINTFLMPVAVLATIAALKLRGPNPTRRRLVWTWIAVVLSLFYIGIFFAYGIDRYVL